MLKINVENEFSFGARHLFSGGYNPNDPTSDPITYPRGEPRYTQRSKDVIHLPGQGDHSSEFTSFYLKNDGYSRWSSNYLNKKNGCAEPKSLKQKRVAS